MDSDTRIINQLEANGKLCRLCLGNDALFNIFNEESLILTKIQQFCSLEIFLNDGLPESVCSSCINIIDTTVNFRKVCEENDKILRKNLSLVKTQIKKELEVKDECDMYESYDEFRDIIEDVKEEVAKPTLAPLIKKFKKRKKTLNDIKIKQRRKMEDLKEERKSVNESKDAKRFRKGFSGSGGLCPYCGKVFEIMSSFNTHVKKHTLTGNFPCKICSKSFNEQRRLKDHERVHLNIRNYPCEACGKLFATKSCAKKHMERVHLRMRIVYCHLCNKKLANENSLRCHMKIHTGERTFECDVCSRKFTFKCSLLVHMRCHTGEKPYACKFCDSRFAALKTIREHERLHTGEMPYLCPVCSKGFTQKSNMKSHFRNNHKGQEMKLSQQNPPVALAN